MKCPGPHKYKRITLSRNKHPVYKCIRCPHYVLEPYVIGREAECWYCGSSFLMDQKSLLLKPHCGCKKTPNLNLEKTKLGAAIDSDKNKVLKIRPKKIDPILTEAKSNIIDHLMSKLGK